MGDVAVVGGLLRRPPVGRRVAILAAGALLGFVALFAGAGVSPGFARTGQSPRVTDGAAGSPTGTGQAGGAATTCAPTTSDLNGDGTVSLLDLAALARYFGQSVPPAPSAYDLNGNGRIELLDVAVLAAAFGQQVCGAVPRLLFGLGPVADSASSSPLNLAAPLGMYSSWYNGPADLASMQYWHDSGFIASKIYGTGRAAHLIIWSGGPNATTPVCGRPYPVSSQINADMVRLARIWAGTAAGPPLYVTLFTEFQTYPCIENQWVGAQDYYTVLQQKMLQIKDIFHQYAPNAKVSIGWGGWQLRWDDPANGAGASLMPYFAGVMHQMDFQSFQSMDSSQNVTQVRDMTRYLGQYGPVMLAHYKPQDSDATTFSNDVTTMLTDSFLGEMRGNGLFAWSFMDQSCFNDVATSPAEAANYQRVRDGMLRYGLAP